MTKREDTGTLPATDERKKIARWTMVKMAAYIQERKLTGGASVLTEQATGGFNLACDFIAHEMRRMAAFDNEEFLDGKEG